MPKRDNMARDIIRALAVSFILAVSGGAFTAYMTLHDVAKEQGEQKGKIEWLYNYIFPKDGSHESPGR